MQGYKNNISSIIKIGYGSASLGDTAVYNMIIIYGLYFFTEIAKLPPISAGNIIFAATIWNAASLSIMGYISDNYPIRRSRRISYMCISIIPMMLSLIMTFNVIHASLTQMIFYYSFIMAFLYTAHSVFMIPYEALGADITSDSDERTALRSYARFFMGIGNLIGIVFMLPAVEIVEKAGASRENAWQITVIIIAVIGAFSQLVTCFVLRGKDRVYDNDPNKKSEKGQWIFFREYWEILKIKPFLYLLAVTFVVSSANVFCNSTIAYFMKYNLQLYGGSKAIVLAVMTIVGIIMTPLISGLSKKYDRKIVMVASYVFSGSISIILGITGINSFFMLCIYIAFITVGVSAYWQLIYAMYYDISEEDEYINGKRREAAILSIAKTILKAANATAAQFVAIILYCFGYNPEITQQGDLALFGIQLSLTIIPGILFMVAAVIVFFYPISRKKHMELVESFLCKGR